MIMSLEYTLPVLAFYVGFSLWVYISIGKRVWSIESLVVATVTAPILLYAAFTWSSADAIERFAIAVLSTAWFVSVFVVAHEEHLHTPVLEAAVSSSVVLAALTYTNNLWVLLSVGVAIIYFVLGRYRMFKAFIMYSAYLIALAALLVPEAINIYQAVTTLELGPAVDYIGLGFLAPTLLHIIISFCLLLPVQEQETLKKVRAQARVMTQQITRQQPAKHLLILGVVLLIALSNQTLNVVEQNTLHLGLLTTVLLLQPILQPQQKPKTINLHITK